MALEITKNNKNTGLLFRSLSIFLILVLFFGLIGFVGIGTANAKVINNPFDNNGLNEIPLVLNSNYHKSTPKWRSRSGGYGGWGSYEKHYNNFRYKKGNKKINFKTNLYLPVSWKKHYQLSLPQSMVFVGDYLYVLYINNVYSNSNYGWVVRYNYKKIKSLGITNQKSKLANLRKSVFGDVKPKSLNKKIKSYIKVGPKIKLGHGQTLSYDKKSDSLYILQDLKKNGKYTQKIGGLEKFLKISKSTLKVTSSISYKINQGFTLGHVLTFDNSGNAYTAKIITRTIGKKKVKVLRIYKGKVSKNNTSFKEIQDVKYPAGDILQSISYNSKEKRLYAFFDGALQSFPVEKLGKLKSSDVKSTILSTNREFEGGAFDKDGFCYISVISGPEILRSTAKLK
jgi:hypothetical protein